MHRQLKAIINHITETAEKSGYWAITTNEIMEITQLEPFKFKMYMSQARKIVNMPEDMTVFNNDNPGDLVTLLECIYDKDEIIEKLFSKTGIFINYYNMIELNELLLTSVNEILSKHKLNEDDFQAMLNGTKSFLEAKNIYLNEEFDIDKIIEDACSTYISSKGFHLKHLAKKNILGYLKSLFERNILSKESVLCSIAYKLEEYAKKHNLFKEGKQCSSRNNNRRCEDYDQKQKGHRPNEGLSRKEKAKRIFNIRGKFNAIILKKKYREMMKAYHPDINPSGLERSKEINLAYSILLAEIH